MDFREQQKKINAFKDEKALLKEQQRKAQEEHKREISALMNQIEQMRNTDRAKDQVIATLTQSNAVLSSQLTK